MRLSHEKIAEIYNRIISSPEESKNKYLILEENKILKVVSDESSSFYFGIKTKGKNSPLMMKFIKIFPHNIILNLYSSYKSKYPCDKSFTDKIEKIQLNRIYKLLNLEILKNVQIGFDFLYLKIEACEKFKLQFVFTFGTNPLKGLEKEKGNSPPTLLKNKVPRLKDIHQHINYILNNKNEFLSLMKNVELIQKKRKEHKSSRSEKNNNIIKSNHDVLKSFYNFKKSRENEYMKLGLRNDKAIEYRRKSMENDILKNILFSNRWCLRKKQVI